MQLKTILNLVEKHPGFVYESPRLRRRGGKHQIDVPIRARRRSRPVCSGCGQKRRAYDRLEERRYQFVPLWAMDVYFGYAPRRCDCPRCGVKVELLPWSTGKSPITTAFAWFLASWAQTLSWKETARRFATSWGVARLCNDAVEQTRRAEARTLRQAGDSVTLKHTRWVLLKRRKNLSDKQRKRLKELLRINLSTVKAYLLKDDLTFFWKYKSPCWASCFLDGWIVSAVTSGVPAMAKVARTLGAHRALLLNWFRARGELDMGAVEGLNNKARVTTKLAYGFRSYEHGEIALFHRLGKLPEPDWLTHRFT